MFRKNFFKSSYANVASAVPYIAILGSGLTAGFLLLYHQNMNWIRRKMELKQEVAEWFNEEDALMKDCKKKNSLNYLDCYRNTTGIGTRTPNWFREQDARLRALRKEHGDSYLHKYKEENEQRRHMLKRS